jgi:N,N'-diacetyllegionaminate synthase
VETVTTARLANGRVLGPGEPPYLIAEIGANHNGDMDLCRRLIDEAKAAGADAVKFQSWSSSSLISEAEYARHTSYGDTKKHFGSLHEMVERYQLSPDQHEEAAAYCRAAGVDFLSTPFSPAEVDLLVALDVPAVKIASMDVVHLPLLECVGRTRLPVLLSTGMATTAEVARAVDTLRAAGTRDLVLLHCVSIYPPEPDTVNLRNMAGLRSAFAAPVGFSDHTIGVAVPLAAVALGACVIEKHFTLDKDLEGWDHAISADPAELAAIAAGGRAVWAALGTTERTVGEAELAKRRQFRRRIVLRRALVAGQPLAFDDLDFKRPGTGIGPDETGYVVGRRVARDLPADHELEWSDLT